MRSIELPLKVSPDFDAKAIDSLLAEVSRYRLSFAHAPEFTRRVWERILKIPRGETMTYGELACAIGKPGAARAVGSAVASNRVLIVVPCHRVVAKNGLGGYRGGVEWKRRLLKIESIPAFHVEKQSFKSKRIPKRSLRNENRGILFS